MIGVKYPPNALGGYFALMFCHGDDMYPSYRTLYGCDFEISEMTRPPPGLVVNNGIEVHRVMKNKLDTKEFPCRNGEK